MGENELQEILGSFKEAIDLLLGKVESLEERLEGVNADVQKVSSALYDEVLAPAQAYLENEAKEERFGDFKEKYGEKLEPLNKTMGAITGDAEYDATRRAFDEFDSLPEPKPDADGFVEETVQSLTSQIEEVKEAFGLAENAEIETKTDSEGNTEVSADGEKIAEVDKDGNIEEVKTEEKNAEKAPEQQEELDFGDEEEADEEKAGETPEDIEKYEEELKKALN